MREMSNEPGGLPSDPADLEPSVRAFRLVLAASQVLRSAMDDHLRPAGLTTQQATVMSIIEASGSPTLGLVASRIGTSHQNLRQIADALVRKGLVQIRTDPGDARRRILELTPRAVTFWSARNADDAEVVAGWFEPLSRAEQDQLVGLLARIVDHASP